MQVKTRVKSGIGMPLNHNETFVRSPRPSAGLKVKTGIKAGLCRQAGDKPIAY